MSSLLFSLSLSLSLSKERENNKAQPELYFTLKTFSQQTRQKKRKKKKKQRKKLFRVLNPKCVVVSFLPLA